MKRFFVVTTATLALLATGPRVSVRLYLEQIPSLAHIDCNGLADLYPPSFTLMNVPAEEVFRLVRFNELQHRAAPGVHAFTNTVQIGSIGWGVTNQDQLLNPREPAQPLSDLLFAILAGRMERRRTGIAQGAKLSPIRLDQLVMNIPQAKSDAQGGYLLGRFVIAWKHPHPAGLFAQDFSATIQSTLPAHQIAGRHIVIRLGLKQSPQRCQIVVDVGKN